MLKRLRHWAGAAKRDILALWLAARDPRVPCHAKAVAAAVAAYALSPIDIIPDFIPVLGYLDELIVVPLGIVIAVWLIPKDIMSDLRRKASGAVKPSARAGIVFVILVWFVTSVIVFVWIANTDWQREPRNDR